MTDTYENKTEYEEITAKYLAENFIHQKNNYSIGITDLEKEKHEKELERIAMEILIEEMESW